MKNYLVKKTNQERFDWLVIATSYISPITMLEEVMGDLNKGTGHVLFDLTLINGIESNRYISAMMRDGVFIRSSFRTESNVSESIKNISRDFFVENPLIVEEGVIPKSLKYMLKEGMFV